MAGVKAYIGLGSNVGRRPAHLRAAVRGMDALPGTRVLRASPVYETSPVGPRQRRFLNAVVEVRTAAAPEALLEALKDLEGRLGRKRRRRWGPREIDLDILLYGERVCEGRGLAIPHPRLAGRRFALVPLLDLAPRLRDPRTGRAWSGHLKALSEAGQAVRRWTGRLDGAVRKRPR